ncbi:hypothetical protein JVT61DRAFT_11749 [Boletus reticuloceps]|uniref:Uncharacterized protein n=1 Tax=Boletus reticuloceps TaxID=495285 RepID=A0A8I2YU62_9AGAM|nr:hypothetical protein JVT61DRAFT_11749 [Boletus reticuloceps]
MHHCLCISEVLNPGNLQFVKHWDDPLSRGPGMAKKTLASLIRTCHLFSSPALDVLWDDLDGFDPILNIFLIAICSTDDPRWSTFLKYAKLSADAKHAFLCGSNKDLSSPFNTALNPVFHSFPMYRAGV